MGKMNLTHITPQRVKELEREIKDAENMLKADKASGRPKIQDENEFRRENINNRKIELRDFSPKKYKGALANKRYTQAKKLKEIIQKAMPSSKNYFKHYPKQKDKDGNPRIPDHSEQTDFDRTVQQQIAFQTDPRIQNAVTYYKHIMARLDPEDPTIRNIEMLRK